MVCNGDYRKESSTQALHAFIETDLFLLINLSSKVSSALKTCKKLFLFGSKVKDYSRSFFLGICQDSFMTS